MIVSKKYVKEKFDEYNALIFDNQLPPIPISIGKARSRLGTFACTRTPDASGRYVTTNLRLRFSSAFDIPESEWEDTIIHEMIHYYLAYFDIRDKSAHGKHFRQMMNDINKRFDRHITISYRDKSAPRIRRTSTKRQGRKPSLINILGKLFGL